MARGKRSKDVAAELGLSPYDSADYLKTEEDMAAYLAACLEEAGDDASYIANALGTIARARGRMPQIARETKLTREGLYKSLSKNGKPSLSTFLKVVRALGMRVTVERAA